MKAACLLDQLVVEVRRHALCQPADLQAAPTLVKHELDTGLLAARPLPSA